MGLRPTTQAARHFTPEGPPPPPRLFGPVRAPCLVTSRPPPQAGPHSGPGPLRSGCPDPGKGTGRWERESANTRERQPAAAGQAPRRTAMAPR